MATKTTGTTGQQKPLRPLTRKQRAFVQHLITSPKDSATEAVAQTYNIKSGRHTAEVIAHENLRKPEIMAELAKYETTAELTLIETMGISRERMTDKKLGRAVDWAVNARQTADSILDRLRGKATQRIESTSTVVTLSLDVGTLTGDSTPPPETTPTK